MKRIIIADDEEHIRRLVRIALDRRPDQPEVRIHEAADGLAALRLAQELRPDLIVLDVQMPGMTGLECCRAIRSEPDLRDTPIILLTALGTPEMERAGRAAGATAFVTKPFRPRQLIATIEQFLSTVSQSVPPRSSELIGRPAPPGLSGIVAADRSLEPQLLAYADDLTASLAELHQAHRELRRAYLETVQALCTALEARDVETAGHCARVTVMTIELAHEMSVPARDLLTLQFGAALHDVGKIGVPDAILRKAGALTDEEWAIMRRHPEMGERMLSGIQFLRDSITIVGAHHERWDGRGYPRGLAGPAIPLGARIFAIADSVDAMTSDRPYRTAASWDEAYDEVVRGSGTQFDPEVVDVFRRRADALVSLVRAH